MSKEYRKPIIGITIGDINGIGPEVIIKALENPNINNHITPVIYGSTKTLSYYKKALELESFNYSQVREQESFNQKKINVINCWEETIEITPGISTKEAGNAAFKSIEAATKDLKDGKIDAVVTAPINKHNIQSEEFKFAGHTEYFTEVLEAKDSLMLLCSEDIRVAVVTGHIPIKDVSAAITKERVENKLKILITTLKKDFGITKPKVAILGLNPHAGEEGLLGDEDKDIILPVIEKFRDKGDLCFGPFPADGFFGTGTYQKYDAVLAMYHDQGLIPFKTIAFESGVNFTAGLSAVRTSPDHGTAYDIAGQNKASEQSMRQAIYTALDIVKNRNEIAEYTRD
jgi:4-hydroxythreonine-4-phosphate dehydrogenase